MAGKWTDFAKNPSASAKNLHVDTRDVAFGAEIDALRAQWEAQNALRDGSILGSRAAAEKEATTKLRKSVADWLSPTQRIRMDPILRAEFDAFSRGTPGAELSASSYAAPLGSPLEGVSKGLKRGAAYLNPLGAAGFAYDLGEGVVDLLRGTQSPSRVMQGANAVYEALGMSPAEEHQFKSQNDKYATAAELVMFARPTMRGLASGVAKNIQAGRDAAAKSYLKAQHDAIPRLEAPSINEAFSPFSGNVYGDRVPRSSLVTAAAALGGLAAAGYAPDAEAIPFHSWMKRLAGTKGETEPLALHINPTRSDIGDALKTGRRYTPNQAVRMMRDRKHPSDVYLWDGSDTLHHEVATHLGRPMSDFTGRTINREDLPVLDAELDYLRKLKQDVPEFAGGGSVAGAARRLAQRAMPAYSEGASHAAAPLGALSVVKQKGGNWLTGSVEDALRGLKKAPGVEREGVETFSGMSNHNIQAAKRAFALDDFIDKQLTRYIKNEMATPEDPIRALAERGVLHFDPALIRERSPLMEKVVGRRETTGFPVQGKGVAPLARNWESVSDSTIRNLEARDLSAAERDALMGGKKVPPDTVVHEVNTFASGAGISDLGFPHLIDELSNAINPASGLPQHLQFPADRLNKVSVPQAVERVAKINAWRAAQKAEADKARANNAATVLHKEYPGGYRWVELKNNEDWHPEYWSGDLLAEQRQRALQDALKYEGDTMQHCVGGYCEDVLSGRSRIFSLRDAKGEPHVTIEVQKDGVLDNWLDNMPEELYQAYSDEFSGLYPDARVGASPEWVKFLHENKKAPQDGLRIIQIKGKQNRKPKDEYLPFVQDFVRSGKWSDVGDLHNTGLRRIIDAFNSNELRKIQEADIEVPQWATPQEIQGIGNKVWPGQYGTAPGMASGGSVVAPVAGWDVLADPTPSPEQNNSTWDIFSGHNDPEQLEAVQ